MVIAFNYKEASKTVTLKEVNGSIIECSGAPSKGYKKDIFLNTDLNSHKGAIFRSIEKTMLLFAFAVRLMTFSKQSRINPY